RPGGPVGGYFVQIPPRPVRDRRRPNRRSGRRASHRAEPGVDPNPRAGRVLEICRHPEKSLREITAEYGANSGYVRRLLNAAYLAPAIKRAVFQGTQPGHLQVQDLVAPRSPDWRVQMRELGFDDSVPVA